MCSFRTYNLLTYFSNPASSQWILIGSFEEFWPKCNSNRRGFRIHSKFLDIFLESAVACISDFDQTCIVYLHPLFQFHFCKIFSSFFGQWSFRKKCFWDLLTFSIPVIICDGGAYGCAVDFFKKSSWSSDRNSAHKNSRFSSLISRKYLVTQNNKQVRRLWRHLLICLFDLIWAVQIIDIISWFGGCFFVQACWLSACWSNWFWVTSCLTRLPFHL